MTFWEAFYETKDIFMHSGFNGYNGVLAMQITMTGEGGGTFYVKFENQNLFVEPYNYTEFNVLFIADTFDFLRIARGEMSTTSACAMGKLRIEGDTSKAVELKRLVRKNY